MFTGELLTRWLAFSENITTRDADVLPRRARGLQEAQEIVDEICNEEHWRFLIKTAPLSLSAGSFEALVPLDFGIIHPEGGIWSGNTQLVDLDAGAVSSMQLGSIVHTGQDFFSVMGYSVTNARRTFQFNFPGAQSLTLVYKRRGPLLVDKPYAAPTLVNGAALGGMPVVSTIYAISYPGIDGYENEISDTANINPAGNRVTVGNIVQPGVTGQHNAASIKIWRGPNDGSGIMRLITTLVLGTTSYIDVMTEATWANQPLLLNQSSLGHIPEAYHQTVVMSGLRARTKKTKGDTRDWRGEYAKGLAVMRVKELPRKSAIQRMPRSVPAGNW